MDEDDPKERKDYRIHRLEKDYRLRSTADCSAYGGWALRNPGGGWARYPGCARLRRDVDKQGGPARDAAKAISAGLANDFGGPRKK